MTTTRATPGGVIQHTVPRGARQVLAPLHQLAAVLTSGVRAER